MSETILCRSCGLEYDLAEEVACPRCTSGMIAPVVDPYTQEEQARPSPPATPWPSPAARPGASAAPDERTRTSLETAERALSAERRRRNEARVARRGNRRMGTLQVALGLPIVLAGGLAWRFLADNPGLGPYATMLAAAPLLIGGGFILLGIARWARGGRG